MFKIKIIYISSTLLLIGCTLSSKPIGEPIQPINRVISDDEISQLKLSEQSKKQYLSNHFINAPLLDKNNYKHVFKNKISGVFQHPYYPDRVFTLINNKSPNIDNELIKYKIKDSYDFQISDYRFKSNKNSIQLSGLHFITDNENPYDANVIILNPYRKKKNDPNFHHDYFLFHHELAHSLNSQYEYIFNKGSMTLLENFSEISASIMTYQLVIEEGYNIDYFKKILKKEKRRTDISSSYHRTQQIFDIMGKVIEENYDYFFNLTPPEIESFSYSLSKKLYDNDYSVSFNGVQNMDSKYYYSKLNNKKYFNNIVRPLFIDKYSLNYK